MSSLAAMQTSFHHGQGQGQGQGQGVVSMTHPAMGSVQGQWDQQQQQQQHLPHHHHPHHAHNGGMTHESSGPPRDAHTHITPSAVLARPQVSDPPGLITITYP